MRYYRVKKRGCGNKYLTQSELELLRIIQKHGETYPYKLSSENGYPLSTAHKLLKNLEKKGFTQSQWEDGKHVHRITSSGLEIITHYKSINSFYYNTIVSGPSTGRLINMGPVNSQLAIRTNETFVQSEFPFLASMTYSFNVSATIKAKSKEGEGFIFFCEKDA